MALKANYEFLFIGKDDNSFLENYAYDLFQQHGEKGGQIFVNLEVQNNQADAEEIGKVIFESMQQKFFENVEMDPYERFEVALKVVNENLRAFKDGKFSGYIGNLNIVVAAIVGNVLYLTQCGDSEAYLVRKRYVSIISEGLSEESTDPYDIFSSIASGKIEEGDFVLFSSTRLLRYISKTDLAKSLSKKAVTDSLNELKDVISTEILGRIGLTGILFSPMTAEDTKEVKEGEDLQEQIVLESNEKEVSSKRNTLTGKFFTALRGYSQGKASKLGLRSRSTGILNSIVEWISNFKNGILSKGFGKDKVLALLIIVIIILAAGIWVANDNNATRVEIQRLEKVLNDVQEKLINAEAKISYDKEGAKVILDKAYSDSMAVLNSGYYRDKAKMYLLQIEEIRDKLDNVIRIDEPKVLVDLTTKRSNINALGFVNLAGRMFVYEYNALYEIILNQVQDPITIDDKETVISATAMDDRKSIVFMTKSGKIMEYREGLISNMNTEDGTFHKGVAISGWNNKLYILDAATNQIWRYPFRGIREKFGPAEQYFTTETVDLSKAQDFAIDAKIYVLTSAGDILKFASGNKIKYYINSAPVNVFKTPTLIYTNDKLDFVYVVDSKESRILVFDKDTNGENLNYKNQYLLKGAGDIRDIYVDPDTKKVLVLTSNKILEVDLQ